MGLKELAFICDESNVVLLTILQELLYMADVVGDVTIIDHKIINYTSKPERPLKASDIWRL